MDFSYINLNLLRFVCFTKITLCFNSLLTQKMLYFLNDFYKKRAIYKESFSFSFSSLQKFRLDKNTEIMLYFFIDL